MIEKTEPKLLSKIGNEWDAMCGYRQQVIDAGKDISFSHVTAPCILDHIKRLKPQKVLDVGCGTGCLTSLISNYTKVSIGIDISPKSIDLAMKKYSNQSVSFFNSSISDFVSEIQFDACVANMVLSCDPIWLESIKRIHELLNRNGKLLVMLPHPVSWPLYWDFLKEEWFNYYDEIYIEHDFSISFAKALGQATYIHRPLSTYINSICAQGFFLESMVEPYPQMVTPPGYSYEYPRFLFMQFGKK